MIKLTNNSSTKRTDFVHQPSRFPTRHTLPVLGVPMEITTRQSAARLLSDWAVERKSKYVCFADVHLVMEAQQCADFMELLKRADMVAPDGTPVSWILRLGGANSAQCVDGPRTTPLILSEAEQAGIPVGFYGGLPDTLQLMLDTVRSRFPKLEIAYNHAPPFRTLTPDEDSVEVERINSSGCRLLFVGLGCPKQERWMDAHKGRVECTMLGVGAVFDFLAGKKWMPPGWIQSLGLTFIVRLVQDPKRLAYRYLVLPVRFLLLLAGQVLRRVAHRPR
jgi:N-acetylglucosaminyldiphosphoundecaprenol N-acetyl-beta-D-mannosaminyltransferase